MLDLKEPVNKLEEDATFLEELMKAGSKEKLLEKLKTYGFELSDNDLEEVIKMLGSLELSDKELEGAAGGGMEHLARML